VEATPSQVVILREGGGFIRRRDYGRRQQGTGSPPPPFFKCGDDNGEVARMSAMHPHHNVTLPPNNWICWAESQILTAAQAARTVRRSYPRGVG
jgi:hypothetical protein